MLGAPIRRAVPWLVLLAPLAALPAWGHDDLERQIDVATARVARAPRSTSERLARAELLRIHRDFEAAERDLAEIARIDPRTPGLDLAWAALALDRGDAAMARELVTRILELRPHDSDALALAARVAASDGRPLNPPGQPGDDATVAPVAVQVSTLANTTLVPPLAVWTYDTPLTDPGTAWRAVGFDDGSWPAGPGLLGFGEAYIATLVPMGPTPTERYPTTYFRHAFTFGGVPGSVTALTLEANYDDGFVAYLNGVEIARRAMPAGPVNRTTLAEAHEGGFYEPVDVTAFSGALNIGDNVLAVEVHQTTLTSTDLVWDAALVVGTDEPAVTRGPYLQLGTSTGVVVRWRTNAPTTSAVRIGTAPDMLTTLVSDAALLTEHEIQVTSLAPATRHWYRVGTLEGPLPGDSTAMTFVTAPAPGTPAPTRIWVIGDSGLPGAAQNAVRDAWLARAAVRPADVWLMLGDNAYNTGTDAEYTAGLFTPYASILMGNVLWPTRGNHDFIHTGAANDYYDFFTLPTAGQAGGVPSMSEAYYSFDYGQVHYVCLDSEGSARTPGSPMLDWLESDLAANSRPWTIAFWHHPPYTKGSHDSDNDLDSEGRMRDMRLYALPILEAYGVDLVLTGHSHSYERSFLLDGHYGPSSTLDASMRIDDGDGRVNGDGAYLKPVFIAGHQGAVYSVVGSSSHVSGGTLDHPVMVASLNVLGSMVVDVVGLRLDARFVDDQGAVRDSFRITKGGSTGVEEGWRGLTLGEAVPNPARHEVTLRFSLPHETPVRLVVFDVTGRTIRVLRDGPLAAGEHRARWDGRDADGRPVGSGVYFYRLAVEGRVLTGRLAWVR